MSGFRIVGIDQINRERHGYRESDRQYQILRAIHARQRQPKPSAGNRHDRLGGARAEVPRRHGEQRAQGVDVDLVFEPSPAWSALFAYAYTDTEVTSDVAPRLGGAFARVPKHSGRAVVRYRVVDGALAGLGFGLGARANSPRELTLPNLDRVPGVTVFDAQLSYTWANAELALSLANLTDKRYFEPYQYLAQSVVIPGDPRSGHLNFVYRF